MTLPQTPSQTVGPFFRIGMPRPGENVLVGEGTEGERIRIEGRVLDGEREPVDDALVEIWQANAHGRYRHPEDRRDLPLDGVFTGFGRCATDAQGVFRFETIRPGPVPDPEGELQAPHIDVTLFARGMLAHVFTRIYFEDETSNHRDWVLERVPEERRESLVARRVSEDPSTYRLDIRLQGPDETVFFDF